MNFYLASAFARHPEMRAARDDLVAAGHTVTSRWIDLHGGDQLEAMVANDLREHPERAARYAMADIQDLFAADTVISFTGFGGRGGRHVEFGLAIAASKRLIVVGPREHVFHALPEVEYHSTWSECLAALTGKEMRS